MRTALSSFAILALLASCAVEAADGSGERALTKDEARSMPKADWWGDFCEDFGWYGDGWCDWWCPSPDPDCSYSAVDVAISAVSLGEDCPERDAARVASLCAPGYHCGSLCQQSTVSLSIDADGDSPVELRILHATLLSADGEELLDLGTSDARIFDGSSYEPWDETIPTPTSDLSVLYDLNGVDWTGIDNAWRRTFKVRLLVEIDGEVETLTSEETTREAPIVT